MRKSTGHGNILAQFASHANKKYLFRAVEENIGETMQKCLVENFDSIFWNFVSSRNNFESLSNEPMYWHNADNYVNRVNREFIVSTIKFLTDYYSPQYPSNGPKYYQGDIKNAFMDRVQEGTHIEVLEKWRQRVARPRQLRDQDIYYDEDQSDEISDVGMTFCDQEHEGEQRHLDFFENAPLYKQLNQNMWQSTPIGYRNPIQDAHLASRNIFRKNEDGEESGVRKGETHLTRRNVDAANVAEGLRSNLEMGYKQRGYNMGELHARIDTVGNFRRSRPTTYK
jgi:hypothetical protein